MPHTDDLSFPKVAGKSCNCPCCQDVATLEYQLSKMAQQLRELKSEQNRTHSVINKCLPPEILSAIFMDCLASPVDLDFCYQHEQAVDFSPLLFGSICHYWRAIAWSTPSLWCQLSCILYPGPLEEKAALLADLSREWLDRSGDLPLSLQILMRPNDSSFSDFNPHPSRFPIHPVIEVIKLYSQRWQDLHLHLWVPYIWQMGSGIMEIPVLRTLKLWPIGKTHQKLWEDVKTAPQVVHFHSDELVSFPSRSTSSITILDFRLDWSNLNDVSVNGLEWNRYVQILKNAPQLKRFAIEKFGQRNHFSSSDQFFHSKLQYFKICGSIWEPSETNSLEAFMSTMNFPSLKELWYDVGHIRWPSTLPTAHLPATFLERLPNLRKLSIRISDSSEGDRYVNLLKQWPLLNYLFLINRDTLHRGHPSRTSSVNEPQPNSLLSHLSGWDPDSSTQTLDPAGLFLPALRTFRYRSDIREPPWRRILKILGPLSEISNRYLRPLGAIHIELGYSAGELGDNKGLSQVLEANKAGVVIRLVDVQG